MEGISERQILFTPTTDLFGMAQPDNDDPEAHRSLWTPKQFEELGYACITFPDYHSVWNGGAFFAWRCPNIFDDYLNVREILNACAWAQR
jgi:hypothetical protein